jgi:hypothetical protein
MRTKAAVAILLVAILISLIVIIPIQPAKAAGGAQLYINPTPVNKVPSDNGTNFVEAVTLSNFINLMGFDINLTWDNSLITETGVDYTTALNALWDSGNWHVVFEQSGAGFYELAVTSTFTAFSNTNSSVLFNVTFNIVKGSTSPLQTPIHFALVKLSDNATPVPNPISATVTDGAYTMSAPQVTFNQTGVGSDFVGTVLTVDGANYTVNGLPVSFWWNTSSVHNFTFYSPLNVGSGEQEQYFWASTTGLSTLRNGSLTVTGLGSVTGNFQSLRRLAITATAGGTTNPGPGNWTYLNGPNVTVTALPNTGYLFDNWVLDNVSVGASNPIHVSMNAPHQLTAVFGLLSGGYTLTITATAGGTTSPSVGNHNYPYGTVVTVTESNSTGYRFNNWTLDGTSAGTASSVQVLMSASHQLQAFFTPLNYTLTITVTGAGTTSPSVGTYSYPYGTIASVTASPGTSYYLDHWLLDGNNNGSANPIHVLMNANHTLQAVFTAGYMLSITVTGAGTTDPSPGMYTYPIGTLANVTALPSTGYYFDHWLLDGNSYGTANSTQVLMSTTHLLTAVFTPFNYFLNITTATNGATNPSAGNYTYPYGTVVPVTALPNTGYGLDHWLFDGVNAGAANPISITINATHQLQAVFTVANYTLAITATVGGATNPAAGSHAYSYNTNVAVTATPSLGYYFDHWVLDSNNVTANPISVTMDTDHSLQAVFTLGCILSITVTGAGTTNPSPGTYTYPNNTAVPVAASPGTGYYFDHWVLDSNNVGATNPLTLTMNTTHQVTAFFTSFRYTLTINATAGGTTNPSPGNYTCSYGTVVAATALPSAGYYFDHWVLDSNNFGASNPTQVTINSDHQLQAIFILVTSMNYTLTITPAAGGTTNPSPGSYVCSYGTVVAVTASSSSGYYFDHWVLDSNNFGASNPIQTTMTANHTLQAIFAPLNYTLTITAAITGGNTDPPAGTYTYSYGTVVNVTAVPSTGYYFDHWVLDSNNFGASNPTQVTMTANHTLQAFFMPLNYTLTITAAANGATSPAAGSYTRPYGTVAAVTAVPNTGYGLDHWLLDGVSAGAANPISITINANHTLTGVFALLNYTLAIAATTGGNTSPAAGSYTRPYGTVVTVNASSGTGYYFDHWLLDGNSYGTASSTQVTMTANHTLQAIFAPLNYTLTITATTGGTTNPAAGTWNYSYGTIVAVTAQPNTGYGLDHWTFDNVSVGASNPIQVLINATHQLTAIFIPGYTLAITATAGGTTSPVAGNYTYSYGTVVTVNASSGTGYYFDHWLLDGNNNGTVNSTRLTMNANHQLKAFFTPLNYTLTITAAANGATSPAAGSYTRPYGTVAAVTAVPNTGYGLDHWLLDGVSAGAANPISITIDANHTLQAIFALFGNQTLTITTTAGGTTSPSPGTYTYSYGTVVTVTASPNTGYNFHHWELDGSNVGAASSTQVTMNANHQLKAYFASPSQAPAVWITPTTLRFDTSHNHVGDRFNVTVWVNTTLPSYAWQVQVNFDASQINVVRTNYTGEGKSLFFAGHGTISVSPIIDNAAGSVVEGESLVGIDQVAAGSNSLCWIEFMIMAAPAGNQTLIGVLSVDSNPENTFILDSDSNSVPGLGAGSAAYTFSPLRDVAVTNFSLSSARPKQGSNVTITVVVLNNGTFSETFDVTITLDSTTIATLSVSGLAPGNSRTLTFVWNTTAAAIGTHTITASATVVPFDKDPSNNLMSKTVTILSPTAPSTDLNGDGKVDMIDIAIAAKAFGSTPGKPNWNAIADVNGDGKIDMIDIAMVARDFGTGM